jgi:hypothetical protein
MDKNKIKTFELKINCTGLAYFNYGSGQNIICSKFVNKYFPEVNEAALIRLRVSFSPPKKKGWKKIDIKEDPNWATSIYLNSVLVSVSGEETFLSGTYDFVYDSVFPAFEEPKNKFWIKITK